MKKLLSAAVAVLALAMAFVGCNNTPEGPKVVEYSVEKFPLEFTENVYDGGANYQLVTASILPATYKAVAGDTVKIHFEGVSDIDIPSLKMNLVDNTAAAGYWLTLGNETVVGENIVAGEDFEFDVEYTVVTSAKGTGADSHKVQLYYEYDVGGAATIYEPGTDVNNVGVLPKELLDAPSTGSVNAGKIADLEALAATYNTVTIKIKNTADGDRTGWGVIKMLVSDAEPPLWAWHDPILGEGEYGMLPPPSPFGAGDEYEYEYSLSSIIDALKEVAGSCTLSHQWTIQLQNGAELESILLTAVDPA